MGDSNDSRTSLPVSEVDPTAHVVENKRRRRKKGGGGEIELQVTFLESLDKVSQILQYSENMKIQETHDVTSFCLTCFVFMVESSMSKRSYKENEKQ